MAQTAPPDSPLAGPPASPSARPSIFSRRRALLAAIFALVAVFAGLADVYQSGAPSYQPWEKHLKDEAVHGAPALCPILSPFEHALTDRTADAPTLDDCVPLSRASIDGLAAAAAAVLDVSPATEDPSCPLNPWLVCELARGGGRDGKKATTTRAGGGGGGTKGSGRTPEDVRVSLSDLFISTSDLGDAGKQTGAKVTFPESLGAMDAQPFTIVIGVRVSTWAQAWGAETSLVIQSAAISKVVREFFNADQQIDLVVRFTIGSAYHLTDVPKTLIGNLADESPHVLLVVADPDRLFRGPGLASELSRLSEDEGVAVAVLHPTKGLEVLVDGNWLGSMGPHGQYTRLDTREALSNADEEAKLSTLHCDQIAIMHDAIRKTALYARLAESDRPFSESGAKEWAMVMMVEAAAFSEIELSDSDSDSEVYGIARDSSPREVKVLSEREAAALGKFRGQLPLLVSTMPPRLGVSDERLLRKFITLEGVPITGGIELPAHYTNAQRLAKIVQDSKALDPPIFSNNALNCSELRELAINVTTKDSGCVVRVDRLVRTEGALMKLHNSLKPDPSQPNAPKRTIAIKVIPALLLPTMKRVADAVKDREPNHVCPYCVASGAWPLVEATAAGNYDTQYHVDDPETTLTASEQLVISLKYVNQIASLSYDHVAMIQASDSVALKREVEIGHFYYTIYLGYAADEVVAKLAELREQPASRFRIGAAAGGRERFLHRVPETLKSSVIAAANLYATETKRGSKDALAHLVRRVVGAAFKVTAPLDDSFDDDPVHGYVGVRRVSPEGELMAEHEDAAPSKGEEEGVDEDLLAEEIEELVDEEEEEDEEMAAAGCSVEEAATGGGGASGATGGAEGRAGQATATTSTTLTHDAICSCVPRFCPEHVWCPRCISMHGHVAGPRGLEAQGRQKCSFSVWFGPGGGVAEGARTKTGMKGARPLYAGPGGRRLVLQARSKGTDKAVIRIWPEHYGEFITSPFAPLIVTVGANNAASVADASLIHLAVLQQVYLDDKIGRPLFNEDLVKQAVFFLRRTYSRLAKGPSWEKIKTDRDAGAGGGTPFPEPGLADYPRRAVRLAELTDPAQYMNTLKLLTGKTEEEITQAYNADRAAAFEQAGVEPDV